MFFWGNREIHCAFNLSCNRAYFGAYASNLSIIKMKKSKIKWVCCLDCSKICMYTYKLNGKELDLCQEHNFELIKAILKQLIIEKESEFYN